MVNPRKLDVDARVVIPPLTLVALPLFIKLEHKFGLPFMALLAIGIFTALVLHQIPSEKSIPFLIGFSILPFDSIYSSVPLLSRFHSSAPFVVVLAGTILMIGKSKGTRLRLVTRARIAPFLLSIFAIAALVSRFQQIPRNMIFCLATLGYLTTLKSYLIKSKFSATSLATPIAASTGVYAILMLLFKNPIALIIQGNYVSKLNSNTNPGRLTGFSEDYEVLGLTLAVGAIACFYLITVPNPLNRIFYGGFFVAISISLLATASVTSLLLAFIGILFIEANGNKNLDARTARGRSRRLLLIGFFILLASQVAIQRFSQRGIHGTNFLTEVTPLRLLNRGQVWPALLSSNSWNKQAIFGQGWPYPYDLFGTWPHNTLLGIWVTGGISLLIVGSIVVAKTVILIFFRIKRANALVAILAATLLLGSITIDLYRTSSLIFLTFSILFTLYWESTNKRSSEGLQMESDTYLAMSNKIARAQNE